jgi:hypothetical protein
MRYGLLAIVTTAMLGLVVRGVWTHRAGIRGGNYALALGEVLAVVVYGLVCHHAKGALEHRFPNVGGYLAEKPGAPYIIGFLGLLLIAALCRALRYAFVSTQVANVSYFMLVWGVVLELKAARAEFKLERKRHAGEDA